MTLSLEAVVGDASSSLAREAKSFGDLKAMVVSFGLGFRIGGKEFLKKRVEVEEVEAMDSIGV